MVVDTIRLSAAFKTPPLERVLDRFRQRNAHYFYRDTAGENPPCFFYYSARDGLHYFSVETSLPRLLYGYNLPILDDGEIKRALDKISVIASENFQVDFDAASAKVGRVDFCANFVVGEDRIFAYLRAAAEASPPRLKRRITGKIQTVEFFNDQRKIYLYDKSRQSHLLYKRGKITVEQAAEATGILRMEARFANANTVRRLLVTKLQLADRKATTVLNSAIAGGILKTALSDFELDKSVVTVDQRIDKIQKYYGYGTIFQQLLGFLQLCDSYGQDNLIERGIVKSSSYYKYLKQLKQAEALVYTTYHTCLPALVT